MKHEDEDFLESDYIIKPNYYEEEFGDFLDLRIPNPDRGFDTEYTLNSLRSSYGLSQARARNVLNYWLWERTQCQ